MGKYDSVDVVRNITALSRSDGPIAEPLEEFHIWRDNGLPCFNFPQRVIYHSPTGMEFGYSGSGPADTALNILALATDGKQALRLHQLFKDHFIATIPRDGERTIKLIEIRNWLDEQEGR